MMDNLLEIENLPGRVRQVILQKTEGNPFFLEEIMRTLIDRKAVLREGDHWKATPSVETITIPDTVQGVIVARIDRLDEELKAVLRAASVIGRAFLYRLLKAVAEAVRELDDRVERLKAMELIREKQKTPELEYIFKHALTQEVAYNSLLLARRKEIHGKIAKAIEELYADRLEEFYEMLAYHYARGEGLQKAGQYLTLLGNKAARRNSLWEAYSFYKEALAALRRLPETEDRKKQEIDVLVLATTPLLLLGYPEGSFGMLQEGEALAKGLEDNRHLSFFYSRLSTYSSLRGNHLLAAKYSEDAFQEGRKSEDIDLIVPVAQGLCFSYLGAGQLDKLVGMAPGVLDLIEKNERTSDFFGGSHNSYASLSAFYGTCLGWLGNFLEGELFLEKGLRHATRIGDLRTSALLEHCYAIFSQTKGDWKAAAEHSQKNIEHSEEAQYLILLSLGWCVLGDAYTHLGDPETGRSYGEKGLKMARDAGIGWGLSWQHLLLGHTHLQLGDLEHARGLVEEAMRLSQKNNEKLSEARAWIFLGRILGRTETQDIHKAEEYMLQGMKIADELKTKPAYAQGHLFLGELYAHSGQKEKAVEHLAKAETMFQEMGMDYWLDETRKVSAGL